jgi:alpha-glucuronidase
MQMPVIDAIRIPRDASPRVRTAADELARWIEKLGGIRPTIGTHSDQGNVTAWLDTAGTDLKPEHYRIQVEGGTTLRITGGDGRGVLYGVQECIDRARRDQAITPMTDGPHFAVRALRMWETPSNKVWCLPFESILDYEKMLRPEECPEYLDFARLLLAMRVNNLSLFAQYAARGSQFERWLSHAEPVEQFARFLDRFGVTVGLSLHYAEPDENGAYENVCPFSDVVQAQWHDFAARLADAMPSVRNAIVWGAGENAPGPHEDDCDRCRALPVRDRVLAGMRLVSEALATIDGELLWPAVTDQAAYAKAETELFGDWGDELPQNVRIAPCHLYWDFRPPYPPHPIWGRIGNRPGERSPYVFELGLVGDTAGLNFLPCSMAHRWQEDFLKAADKNCDGFDANLGLHPHYVDHPLNLSNWHTYGKLCWNPYLDPDDILSEWLTMEYGAEALAFLPGLRATYPATIGALFSRSGLTQCHSYVARYSYLDTRLNGPWRIWTDYLHPGMDRVGENVLGLELPLDAYPEQERETLRNDPRYQLIFNRVPLTDAYAAELMAEKQPSIAHMKSVLAAWRQLEGKIDPASFAQVAGLLEANVNDVRIFVDCFGLYLDYKLGRLQAAQIEAMRNRYADVPKGEATVGSPYDGWFWDHFGWQGTYLEFLDDLDKLLQGETPGPFLAAGVTEVQME